MFSFFPPIPERANSGLFCGEFLRGALEAGNRAEKAFLNYTVRYCTGCVALHRYHNGHTFYRLQLVVGNKIKTFVGTAEMIVDKKGTAREYWHCVYERNKRSRR